MKKKVKWRKLINKYVLLYCVLVVCLKISNGEDAATPEVYSCVVYSSHLFTPINRLRVLTIVCRSFFSFSSKNVF